MTNVLLSILLVIYDTLNDAMMITNWWR